MIPEQLIELHDASVVLGDARVLDSLTLTIAEGQHTAILGPNGAGKSTLMKLLALEIYPLVLRQAQDERPPLERRQAQDERPSLELRQAQDERPPQVPRQAEDERMQQEPLTLSLSKGEPPIRLFGRERWDVSELRTQMGIVSADVHDRFVQGNSNGSITALDAALSGFFATQGVFGHQPVTPAMRDAAADALARIGVAHLARTPLDRMSTGEARRVLIARALVHQPRLLVLDEPTRGLDLVARHQFMERVRRLVSPQTTLLLVTHYLDEIIPEIDRIVLLDRGRIVADGAKRDVLTAKALGSLFGAPLAVAEDGGYFTATVDRAR